MSKAFTYRVETRVGSDSTLWVPHQRWLMLPRMLSRFLHDFCGMYNIHPNKVRVKRAKGGPVDFFFLPGGRVERPRPCQ
jgi:hypothetical protein